MQKDFSISDPKCNWGLKIFLKNSSLQIHYISVNFSSRTEWESQNKQQKEWSIEDIMKETIYTTKSNLHV
jgi:hypothetical protein